jgi:undecaprenyl-diphosphatase
MTLTELNIKGFRMINDLGKQYTFLNPSFVAIAQYTLYVLIFCALLFAFSKNARNRLMVICSLFTVAFAELLGRLAGTLHSNQQPFAELEAVNKLIEKAVDNSFPSDHTILIFSFCLTFWLFKRGWSFLWVLLAALVGVSRIWVGVHYPGDVLVGAFVSFAAAIIVFRIVPKLGAVQKLAGVQNQTQSRYEEL